MDTMVMQKYHGLGNDYLVLDPVQCKQPLQARQIELLCRRNFGVGADGILYGPLWKEEQIWVEIYNPDGSWAEKSGNGIRIFAKYLRDQGYIQGDEVTVYTVAGPARIAFLDQKGDAMRVDMGIPVFASEKLPVEGLRDAEIINEPMRFDDNFYNTTCLSMGNPNCVIMMEEISAKKAVELGPYVESAGYFPKRMNLQLLKVLDPEHLQIEIYERGAGYTLASGTGACAAAAAAWRMGLAGSRVWVEMPGGQLLVEIQEDGRIFLTGTVEYVGEIRVAEGFLA